MGRHWRDRLRELTLAGGALLLAGCPFGVPVCNANPDPCCREPDGAACAAEHACEAGGGTWESTADPAGRCFTDDAGVPADMSEVQDAGRD